MPKTEEYEVQQRQINGVVAVITSYRLGAAWHCTIASADPGANIARSTGTTRQEALDTALVKAQHRIRGGAP